VLKERNRMVKRKKQELTEEKAGLSRRDFLKGVGGGAIGTAMVSTGLLSASSLEAAQKGLKGKRKIPEEITQDDFKDIRQHLETVLKELTSGKTDAMIVNMRLNKTGTEDPAPVFVGWVEDETLKKLRVKRKEKDPGSSRLKDTVPATEYTETLKAKGVIQERDWCALKDGRATLAEKSPQQKALVPRAGLMYQRLIGIVVQDGSVSRSVGTMNLAFPKKPADQLIQNADNIMKTWATNQEKSKLIQFLRDNFQLGGPTI
jgi:hypothetical protein